MSYSYAELERFRQDWIETQARFSKWLIGQGCVRLDNKFKHRRAKILAAYLHGTADTIKAFVVAAPYDKKGETLLAVNVSRDTVPIEQIVLNPPNFNSEGN